METFPYACSETIVDSTEDTESSLFRGYLPKVATSLVCRGVHKDIYAVLTSNKEPLVGPSCSLAEHSQVTSCDSRVAQI